MIELAKHIECLLLDNDCVTIPELGGFIAHYQPAQYVEAEGLFLPPMRMIGFNPQLNMNDGLLVQSYMQAYHTDFPDATRKIQHAVDKMKEILFTDGVVELHGLGVLNYNIYGLYEFHPCEGGVLSPSLYALSSFSMAPLAEEQKQISEPVVLPNVEKEEEKKAVRMLPQWVSHVAAVIVAAVLFFALSVPVENTYVDSGSYASLGTHCLFDETPSPSKIAPTSVTSDVNAVDAPQQQTVKPVAVKTETVAPAAKAPVPVNAVKEDKTEKKEVKNVSAPSRKRYHVIVSSLATAAEAQKMLQKFQQKGYDQVSVVEGNGRFRIALYSFSEHAQATCKLNELKQDASFGDAWLLTTK